MIVNFTKEQIDYIKKAVDHVDFLTGGSRNSKTKQIIEELQQEDARLKDKIKDLEEWLEAMASMYEDEYKDVDASEHYKCMLYKLKEN